MTSSRIPFYFLIICLIALGLGLTYLRHSEYGVPYLPNENVKAWEIEARIDFEATGKAIKVELASPSTQDGFTKIDEKSASLGYGFKINKTSQSWENAQWFIREAIGPQTIYFTITMLSDLNAKENIVPPGGYMPRLKFDKALTTALNSIANYALERSAEDISYVQELVKQFNDLNNQTTAFLTKKLTKEKAISALLTAQSIPNNIVYTLKLEDGRRQQSLIKMISFWDKHKTKWELLDLDTGTVGKQANIIRWNVAGQNLLDVIGGEKSHISFSMIEQRLTPAQATKEKVIADQLLNFSIHSLPIEKQSMFKTILLIPIGALLVVFLRIFIGLKTSGTFMPVLIAVAFVQTQLVPGVVSFLVIISIGLIIRAYLSKLNLLLVARISAVIVTIVLLISLFTIISYKLGLSQGMTVTFFPMIILSWTVERMSIIWEEEGYKEVLAQGGGSLITAVLIYLVMTNELVRHLTFNFIGLQFVVLALILAFGNYTGYRLSELRRFRPFLDDIIKNREKF